MTIPDLENTERTVSVIGLGQMGSTIAQLLLRAGYTVTVWNRTSSKADDLAREGANVAPTAASAIAASPFVIVCVYDYKATIAILESTGVRNVLSGKTLIQLSTGSPQEARESEAWTKALGAHYLDGAIQAAPNQIGRVDTPLLLSGSKETFEQSEALLKVLAGNIVYLGEKIGAASAMDLATLSYVYGSVLGFFHGARISENEGFDLGTFGSIIADIAPTFGEFLKHEGTVLQNKDFAISQSPLRISAEATARLLETAQDSGINTEFPAFASGVFQRAISAGYGDEELAAIIKVWRTPK